MSCAKNIFVVFFVLKCSSLAAVADCLSMEESLISTKLDQFYSSLYKPNMLNERPLKCLQQNNVSIEPNRFLKSKTGELKGGSLEELAQEKGISGFQNLQCNWLNEHTFGRACQRREALPGWEAMDRDNEIQKLTHSWVPSAVTNLDLLPVSGQTALNLWSDDYWRLEWGGISYRYSAGKYFSSYKEAINDYLQPDLWLKLSESGSASFRNTEIENWAPSEKYDIAINDLNFELTREQKEEGKSLADENGEVESWMGLCHGWAAASIMAPKAERTVNVWGPQGTQVRFFPHDIRALTTLAWANGYYQTSFIGNRCQDKKPEVFENGRVKDSQCFDNNPASFHLALGNMIGLARASFVMDAAFDYQVWNQPIKSYVFTYFNPLVPNQRSKKWADVAVPYDEKFKARDPFQKPLTRGKRGDGDTAYDDSKISKVVGVIASVVYLGEVAPSHGDDVSPENFIRVTYTYDLELSKKPDGFEVVGGEWHTNAHPDFLWVPVKGELSHALWDLSEMNYSGIEMPIDLLTRRAKFASKYGYPLCTILSHLLESSSGESYVCQ